MMLTLSCAACAGHQDAKAYAEMRDDDLCASYRHDSSQQDLVRAEIDKRGLIPSYDWGRVSRGDVGYGMGRCAVLAAWHKPETMVGGGSIEIWTFEDDRIVRFQNGSVRSTTDFR